MYFDGQGVRKNMKQAARWFTKAAEQGNVGSQAFLGLMYSEGQGVPQDYKQAVKWHTKAAKQGSAISQYDLALKYYHGNGVLQDYTKSHKWFNLAAANGYELGKKYRDLLAEEMTSDQIAEAQKMARELVEANPEVMGE